MATRQSIPFVIQKLAQAMHKLAKFVCLKCPNIRECRQIRRVLSQRKSAGLERFQRRTISKDMAPFEIFQPRSTFTLAENASYLTTLPSSNMGKLKIHKLRVLWRRLGQFLNLEWYRNPKWTKRHPFILFEVFLALALLAICLIPITSNPFRVYEQEKKALLTLEVERIIDESFAKFISHLSSYETFDELAIEKNHAKEHCIDTFSIPIDKMGTYSYEATMRAWVNPPKESDKAIEVHLLYVELVLHPLKKKQYAPSPIVRTFFIEKDKNAKKHPV